jgi:hypothetical protein
MGDLERPDDVEAYDLGEPAPTLPPVERFAPASGATPLSESRDGTDAVPASPLHLCPVCAYNLTGLTSRRCPECGKPFTLSEARRRGGEMTAEAQEDYRVLRGERVRLVLGTVMFLIGYLAPIVYNNTPLRKWVMTVLVGTMFSLIVMYKVFLQKGWDHAMMIAGLLSIVIGAMILSVG